MDRLKKAQKKGHLRPFFKFNHILLPVAQQKYITLLVYFCLKESIH
jgi:hypothetical protein